MIEAAPYRDLRVLVTGASGFLGRHLVRALQEHGTDVHVLVRQTSISPGVTAHVADLRDAADTTRALAQARPDILFHLAAYGARPGQDDRQQMLDTNIMGSANLWRSLPAETGRVVMTGTCGEYAPADGPVDETYACGPVGSYTASKHAAATMLSAFAREEKRALTIVRPYGPYGPGDDSNRVIPFTIRALLQGAEVPLSDGRQLHDFTYIDDQIGALLRAGAAAPDAAVTTYNVGSGRLVMLRSVLEMAADAIAPGVREKLRFGVVRRVHTTNVLGADISRAREKLGFNPMTDLEEGLRRTVAWHRSRVVAPARI